MGSHRSPTCRQMRTRSQFACRNSGTGAQDPSSGPCYRAKMATACRGLKISAFCILLNSGFFYQITPLRAIRAWLSRFVDEFVLSRALLDALTPCGRGSLSSKRHCHETVMVDPLVGDREGSIGTQRPTKMGISCGLASPRKPALPARGGVSRLYYGSTAPRYQLEVPRSAASASPSASKYTGTLTPPE
jgi:hypothetical protein